MKFIGLAILALFVLSCTCPLAPAIQKLVALKPTATFTPSPPTATPIPPPFSLAFASDYEGNGEIYRFDSDTGNLTNLTNHPAVDWDPAFSPDGSHIAFTSHRDGNSELYIMKADGSNPTNITNHPADDYMPAWSPDGEKLVFVSERDGNQEIYTINRDGSGVERLTNNETADRAPAWSPDGKKIAFAGVVNAEEIHVINVNGSEEKILTSMPLKGTHPAWSPDGKRLAFVGWDEDDRPGLYVMNADGSGLTWIFENKAWTGSLAWTPQGGWLLYTSWQDENHEIYAISSDGSEQNLVRVTSNLAWDDTPSLSPAGGDFQPKAALPISPSPPQVSTPPLKRIELGMNLADLSKAYLLRDLGFTWAKSFIDWEGIEGEGKGKYNWVDPDNIVKACSSQGLKILLRVQWTPEWARPPGTPREHPPSNPQDFADFMQVVAERYKGKVNAYEIWNEPNLDREWGGKASPQEYVALLKAVYPAIKEVDREVLVIAGGPSTTGRGGEGAIGDLDFIRGMYEAGGKGYFDALSSHPYGFGHDPDYEDEWGLFFARASAQHEVMAASGDGETPIWITEFGWPLRTGWEMGEHAKWMVNEEEQATYLVRACRKADEEWPWAQALLPFNLDFSTVPWYRASEIMRWYAILHPDRSPRLAYTRLRMMARRANAGP
ncbi:MAG: cellulase family glycosylhydrolase [Anaerolineae bacterium]